MTTRLRWLTFVGLVGMVALVSADLVQANTPQPQFHMGRLWLSPEYDGAEGWSGSAFQYPGGIPKDGSAGTENEIKRGWVGNAQKWGSYLFTKNWTDPESTTWDDAASYFFRSMNYNYPVKYTSTDESGNMNYLYGTSVQEILRWERPVVAVTGKASDGVTDTSIAVQFFPGEEGLDSVVYKLPDHSGVLARPLPQIDPDLVGEEVIEMVWRHIQGVELKRYMYGYPYGSPHQDYQLWDITLTNNGISGNVSDAPVLTDQSIENMVWCEAFDRRDQQAPGKQQGRDVLGKYIEPFGTGNHTAVLFEDGDEAEDEPGPDYGDPMEGAFYQAQMASNCATLIGPVFVSAGPGADYATDDPAQPAFRMMYHERGIDIAGKPYSPADPTTQRQLLTLGIFQLPLDVDYAANVATAAPASEDQGPTALIGYGKIGTTAIDGTSFGPDDHGWDLAFNESVRIVQMVAGGGIDQDEARRIAADWITLKAAGGDASGWMTAADQELMKSGADTALKAAALAEWNFNGALPTGVDKAKLALTDVIDPKPAGYGEFDVPEAPRPPAGIYVRSLGQGNGIEVRWTKEAELAADHDTDVADVVGYRVYRQEDSRSANWELVSDGMTWEYLEKAAEGSLPAGRYFIDKNITAGIDYWYSVTAYDDGSQNWGSTAKKSLESSRWWTWTGYSHIGVTAEDPGPWPNNVSATKAAFALSQNSPNPFNPTTTINFAVPAAGDAKLVVYNMAGQVVRTLVNGTVAAGVHTVSWDSKDAAGRDVASGVYVYRLTSGTKQLVKRMTLVR